MARVCYALFGMLLWPANSWLFWVGVAIAFALAMRFGLFPAQGANVSRKRVAALLILAAGAVVAVIVLPMLAFATATDSTAGSPLDFALWTGAIFLGVLALLVATWALFADSARGRKRCPKCWYDMSASPTLTCPECGTTAKSPAALLRTRRRWRVLLVSAALVLLSGASAIGPHYRRGEAYDLIPDAGMLLLAPFATRGVLSLSIDRRLSTSEAGEGVYDHGGLWLRLRRWAVRSALARTNDPVAHGRGIQLSFHLQGPDPSLVPRLCELAESAAPGIGASALHALAIHGRGDPEAIAAVNKAIEGGDPRRIGVAVAFYCLYGQDGRLVTITVEHAALARHPNATVRQYALHHLWNAEHSEMRTRLLREALGDVSPTVRGYALMTIAWRPPLPEFFHPALLAALQDADPQVSRSAIWALLYSSTNDSQAWAFFPSALGRVAAGDADYLLTQVLSRDCSSVRIEAVLETAQNPLLRQSATRGLLYADHIPDEYLLRLRALEEAWRAAGDTVAADAMAQTILTIEQRMGAEPIVIP